MECAKLLSEGGVFIVQCPNGLSKEGLLYPRYWLRFLLKVKRSNNWGWMRSSLFSLTSKYGWGLDPIRHLWAVSGTGIAHLFKDSDDYLIKIKCASLADPVYSPYWRPSGRLERWAGGFARILCKKFNLGMHLVVEIRKK